MKTKSIVLLCLLTQAVFGQEGVSSGSLTLLQSNGLSNYNERGHLNERMVIVEDFINYHRHKIDIPTDDEIALSIDYDNTLLDGAGEFVLQVGLATKSKENCSEFEGNLNLSLVVDVSGSMSGSNKMDKVKNAIKTFVDELSPDTYLSIVAFSSGASVLMSSQQVGRDKGRIHQIVDAMYPSGSTNINAGMMLGYEEAAKGHGPDSYSRVILLTDGMVNTGEVNPEKIIENSKAYNDTGIEISTIGVGQSLDFDLLRNLAEAGRGSNHFIGDAEMDIQKVFVDELESLLYQIGKNPELTITLPEGFAVTQFYGYTPRYVSKNKITVSTENLNAGITQVFLLHIKGSEKEKPQVEVQLTFESDQQKKMVSRQAKVNLKRQQPNEEVGKNFSIAYMAAALKQYAKDYTNSSNQNLEVLRKALDLAGRVADPQDVDVKRVIDILEKIAPADTCPTLVTRTW